MGMLGSSRLLLYVHAFAIAALAITAQAAFAAVDPWLQDHTRSWESIDPNVRAEVAEFSGSVLKPRKENLIQDSEVLGRIQSVIDRIVHAPLNQELFQGLEIKFYLFKSSDMNMHASSLEKSSGVIWIHGRILLSLQSESEFAALLAHEMGHILARHSLSAMTVPLTGTNLKQPGIIQKILKKQVRRDQERECDLMAAHLLANAGYDPRSIISALTRIETREVDSCPGLLTRLGSMLQNHPLTYDRIQNVEKHLREYPHLNLSERYPERSWEDWSQLLKPFAPLFF